MGWRINKKYKGLFLLGKFIEDMAKFGKSKGKKIDPYEHKWKIVEKDGKAYIELNAKAKELIESINKESPNENKQMFYRLLAADKFGIEIDKLIEIHKNNGIVLYGGWNLMIMFTGENSLLLTPVSYFTEVAEDFREKEEVFNTFGGALDKAIEMIKNDDELTENETETYIKLVKELKEMGAVPIMSEYADNTVLFTWGDD